MGANKKTTLSEQLDKLKQDGGNGVLSKRRVGARTHAVHTVGILPSFFYFQPTFTIFQSTNHTPIFQAA
ncbi:hypothetical protein [Alysiella crassa]|uniref:Uncharacterized protein n=1 Tax=Alysiella crassa TaxID=153491 RepID=A0A376BWJ7_9NEIS|nr:hypothetical protein [Alysiella crassa]UOP06628.1 hypothetical protein LVJ80_12930 [Alysiella crassa]SSY81173.1 Uncharacterised protein [Alysiella crassa]